MTRTETSPRPWPIGYPPGFDDPDLDTKLESARIEDADELEFGPVGLIEIDSRGTVRSMNPAAARMLAPAITDTEGPFALYPVLDRLHPGLLTLITGDPTRTGPLHPGRRILVEVGDTVDADAAPDPGRIELRLVRVDRDRVMVACSDVTEEQRLARRTHARARPRAVGECRRAAPGHDEPSGCRSPPVDRHGGRPRAARIRSARHCGASGNTGTSILRRCCAARITQ